MNLRWRRRQVPVESERTQIAGRWVSFSDGDRRPLRDGDTVTDGARWTELLNRSVDPARPRR